jgi:aminotransferase
VRPPPDRLRRLPAQYFTGLLGRVQAAAAREGPPLVDLGRGNPEVGPPAHVVERLASAAREPRAHGYAPFRGLPALREAVAARYRDRYGVELDPDREVAVVPGTKSALVELSLLLAERGEDVLLPDPGYPDYHSGVALAGARVVPLPLEASAGWAPDLDAAPPAAALALNYPSNPCATAAPAGVFAAAVRWAVRTGGTVVHDFAYGDLVFDGRSAASFLAEPGAREAGVELFSMSKTYGMAGWRLGCVVGSAEVVDRVNVFQDHVRAGVFMPVQEAGIAALTGPEDSVDERRERYRRRRDRVLAALPRLRAVSEGTFYVWVELPAGLTAASLLEEHRLVVAPGEGFGARGAGWIRLSLAVTDEALELGLERLGRALE